MRVWCIVFSLLLVACGMQAQKQIVPTGQIIVLCDQMSETNQSDTVRFGRLHEGEQGVLPLVFHNKTPRPILIRTYERTCGCTVLEFDNQPIMPDEKRAVTLSFDARGAWGWQLKLIDIDIEGLNNPVRLVIEAEVE
jgi:hypothetical protein